ncbi:DUF3124 domain-containing protein [Zhouia sp. PK063]|uniref:DUF3124 domain-containing protein n=1 Tax=Zhouia sp. PK063 TaxID=3373602 RepID=UPI0037B25E50
MKHLLFICLFSVVCTSCKKEIYSDKTRFPSHNYTYTKQKTDSMSTQGNLYVPVYSDIYYNNGENKYLLTSTLSIRNTSSKYKIYINKVNYYDSKGEIKRKYLQKTLVLNPLESIEFVVESEENEGGAGANFSVHYANNSHTTPLVQAVMIGTASNQGIISFVTNAVKAD